jgi:shikimate kinase
MARVLVTGMSGAGKTTVLGELRRRGHLTVDTDYDGWVLPDGTWDEPRMHRLLRSTPDVVVSGTVENQVRFYDRFEQVVLLSAPLPVLVERVTVRTDNPYGRTAEQQAEIARYVDTVEPLLRRGATLELDGERPPAELADVIEALLIQTTRPSRTCCGADRTRAHSDAEALRVRRNGGPDDVEGECRAEARTLVRERRGLGRAQPGQPRHRRTGLTHGRDADENRAAAGTGLRAAEG